MLTITTLLLVLALIFAVVSAAGRAPVHVAVLLLIIVELLERLPR